MYIYIILKIILQVYGVYINKSFKNYIMVLESMIIIGYFYLLYLNEININKYLFIWCLGWIIFFISYKSMNYVFENRKKILDQIKERISEKKIEKIKEFFLKPRVCDIIYYGIWMLPWNIGYWTYFYVMEHGWYLRVWITSTRDVILWKIFKWDSRMFFFELNKKIYWNKIMQLILRIKEEIVNGFIRILLVISYIRKNFVKITIIEYIMNRILVFCYLSMFYLYMIEGIQIINKWILFFFLFGYILVFFFSGFFLTNLILNNKYIKFEKLCYDIFGRENIYLILDPLYQDFFMSMRLPFEEHYMVWNKILGNSISLNILNEYMLYVNKNTKGYYYYKYGILTKIKSIKLYEANNIPWNIIPQTRYILMSMRYSKEKLHFFLNERHREWFLNRNFEMSNNSLGFLMKNFIIKNYKNFYLSFTEKTYNDVSFLYMAYLLHLNYDINYMMIYENYYKKILKELKKDKKYYFFDDMILSINLHKMNMWKLCLIDIHKKDNNILNIAYILYLSNYKSRNYNLISLYLSYLEENISNNNFDNIMKTEIKYANLKKYKENIKILTHFLFLEEEGIVWNKELMKFFNEIEKLKQNEEIKKEYQNNLQNLSLNYIIMTLSVNQAWTSQEVLKLNLIKDLEIKFNFDINELLDKDFDFLNILKLKEYKVIAIENEFIKKGILKELEDIVKDLENLNMNENQEFRGDYFNKELFENMYKIYIKNNEEKNNKKL